MTTTVATTERDVTHVEDAHLRPMMGLDILEPLPSRSIPYEQVDPFILVHEGVVPITPEWASRDTKHPHRGFDNLWYLVSGSASTGHSTGPDGAIERARLETGSLLKLRTGRGVWHAEGIGEDEVREGTDGGEMRGILFWVNLARKDKGSEPSAQVLRAAGHPNTPGRRRDRPDIGRGRVAGELGTPGLVLDVEMPTGGAFSTVRALRLQRLRLPARGRGRLRRQPAPCQPLADRAVGAGSSLTVHDAAPGTRFMLMAGMPYGEVPIYNGPYVD